MQKQHAEPKGVRDLAYARGKNIARKLFRTISAYRNTDRRDSNPNDIEFSVAKGFADGLRVAMEDVMSLLPYERRKHMLSYLIDDLTFNANRALRALRKDEVSPWVVHLNTMRGADLQSSSLRELALHLHDPVRKLYIGLHLVDMDEEHRLMAFELLEDFASHGGNDAAFKSAIKSLQEQGGCNE
jgi:hypothetical protein